MVASGTSISYRKGMAAIHEFYQQRMLSCLGERGGVRDRREGGVPRTIQRDGAMRQEVEPVGQ